MNINSNNTVKYSTYVDNAQFSGMQRGAMNRTKENDASLETTDSVKLSLTEGPKAGAQTGMAQEKGKTESMGKTAEEGGLMADAKKETTTQPQTAPAPSFEEGGVGSQLALPAGSSCPQETAVLPEASPEPQQACDGASSTQDAESSCVPPSCGNPSSDPIECANKFKQNTEQMLQLKQIYQEIQQSMQKTYITMMEAEKKHWDDINKMIMEGNQARYTNNQMLIAGFANGQMAMMAKWSAILGGYDK